MNKKSKVAITIVLSLLLLIIILYATGLYGKIIENYFRAPETVWRYINDSSTLNPGFVTFDKVDCNNLSHNQNETVNISGGNVVVPLQVEDYCIAIEAIEKGSPDLCGSMIDDPFRDYCVMVAAWQNIFLCEQFFAHDTRTINRCFKEAVNECV